MKHTQGPWTLETKRIQRFDAYTGQPLLPEIRYTVVDTKTQIIMVISDPWVPNAEANSHLIAAAPDLLACLKDAVAKLQEIYGAQAYELTPEAWLNAITKADGG